MFVKIKLLCALSLLFLLECVPVFNACLAVINVSLSKGSCVGDMLICCCFIILCLMNLNYFCLRCCFTRLVSRVNSLTRLRCRTKKTVEKVMEEKPSLVPMQAQVQPKRRRAKEDTLFIATITIITSW